MTAMLSRQDGGAPRLLTWRKLAYILLAVAGAVLVSVWFPGEKTVRLAWRIAPENHSVMQIVIPDNCRLSACYLRIKTPLPKPDAPLVIDCSGETVAIDSLNSLPRSPVKAAPGTEHLQFALPPAAAARKRFLLRQKSVPAALGQDNCELVLEISGPEEAVRDWAKIAKLEPNR